MLIEELLKELKEYRNELVSKNYPFQRISNLIVKYDDKFAIINFKNEISEDEIHGTLVSMIKEIE